jgi:hypothetical protein
VELVNKWLIGVILKMDALEVMEGLADKNT